MRTREEVPGRSPIPKLLQAKHARLPEKKLQLVDMSILSILLSLWTGVSQARALLQVLLETKKQQKYDIKS